MTVTASASLLQNLIAKLALTGIQMRHKQRHKHGTGADETVCTSTFQALNTSKADLKIRILFVNELVQKHCRTTLCCERTISKSQNPKPAANQLSAVNQRLVQELTLLWDITWRKLAFGYRRLSQPVYLESSKGQSYFVECSILEAENRWGSKNVGDQPPN
jgi:hypothetical protein